MKMSLTFDVEEWPSLDEENRHTDNLSIPSEGMHHLLEILEERHIKATFFTTGYFTEKRSKLMREVVKRGHEIACHGYVHQSLISLDNITLKSEIIRATKILRRIAGIPPVGFRAPQCLIDQRILDILEELGYRYDSSIHPTFIPGRYFNLTAPVSPYHPSSDRVIVHGERSILEIPISVTPILRLPLSWWWLRNFGSWWSKFGFNQVLSQGYVGVFYAHPWEFVSCQKVDDVAFHMVRNTGSRMRENFSNLIDYLQSENQVIFVTMSDIVDMYESESE
jgi:peptidoglycan/xylan/chitin deacetylase (PgdA/CDA1 family)